jgi:dephospho-CoA kinase/predicted metal-dependent HD superfamily phosphohydrolase
MGTGKSTLASWLATQLPGYEFFSVDALVAELYTDPAFTAALTERLGVAERKAVSRVVFNDSAARAWLEALATTMLEGKLTDILARPRIVVEFPLLMEMVAPYAQFDVRIATWCPTEVQHERIAARDGLDAEHTERKLAAQMDGWLKAMLADIVVDMTYGPDERVLEEIAAAQVRVTLKARCEAFFGSTAVWPALAALYDAPGRVAHGLPYLAQVLARLDAQRHLAANPKALELAAWFHLAGLSLLPGQYSHSPVRSARLMWQVLADAASPIYADREALPLAAELIASLQFMQVDSAHVAANAAWSADAGLFLDVMLLAYAAPETALERHWADTRAELQAIPALRESLPALLMELVSRPRLLATEALHATHEAQVREGISHLLQQEPYPFDLDPDAMPDEPAGQGASAPEEPQAVEPHSQHEE